MKGINRRRFLQWAGTSSLAAAAVAVPTLAATPQLLHTSKEGTFTFRAVTGLPSKPLPGYASYVIEGYVNLTDSSGVMTKTLFAGAPESMSTVALPGMSRIMRITKAQNLEGTFHITGVIDDRSQLQRGESAVFDLLIDPTQGIAKTSLLPNMVLTLER